MKKTLLCALMAVSLMYFSNTAFAQMPDGSYGQNFTMQDYLGTTYSLYTYTDAGKPVIMDISATWCSPCWSYHSSGALEDYYAAYGPAGDNTSMVFWIEGDQSNLNCLQDLAGCDNGTSQGDWTSGTTFPMFLTIAPNDNQVVVDYQISYFPTVYLICPNRRVTEIGQQTAANLHAGALACPAAGVNALDAAIWKANEPLGSYCSSTVTPEFWIQNYGSTILTSANILVKVDGVTVSTTPWTGSLAKYEIDDVPLPAITGLTDGSHNITFEVASPNGGTDENAANNTKTNAISIFSNGANILVSVLTDDYPTETSWEIKDGTTLIASSDPYADAQTTYNDYVCLEPDHCYVFYIYDEYGDGMSYGGVTGNVTISVGGTTLATIAGDSFTTEGTANFCTPTVGVEDIPALSSFNVYPNPVSDDATIEFALTQPENVSFFVYNLLGEKVTAVAETAYTTGTNKINLDVTNLEQGIYYLYSVIGDKNFIQKLTVVK